jgi:hypothetical protein
MGHAKFVESRYSAVGPSAVVSCHVDPVPHGSDSTTGTQRQARLVEVGWHDEKGCFLKTTSYLKTRNLQYKNASISSKENSRWLSIGKKEVSSYNRYMTISGVIRLQSSFLFFLCHLCTYNSVGACSSCNIKKKEGLLLKKSLISTCYW